MHLRMAQKYWIAYDPGPLAMMTQVPTSMAKANRSKIYTSNMKFIKESAEDFANATQMTQENVVLYGFFPYYIISLCRPFLHRLRSLPDSVFAEPRNACKQASFYKLTILFVKFTARILQVRIDTWRWRARIAPLALQHAAILREQQSSLGRD